MLFLTLTFCEGKPTIFSQKEVIKISIQLADAKDKLKQL